MCLAWIDLEYVFWNKWKLKPFLFHCLVPDSFSEVTTAVTEVLLGLMVEASIIALRFAHRAHFTVKLHVKQNLHVRQYVVLLFWRESRPISSRFLCWWMPQTNMVSGINIALSPKSVMALLWENNNLYYFWDWGSHNSFLLLFLAIYT